MMDHLYNRLDGIYPHKFSSFFTDLDAIDNWKNAWAEAFAEEGITPQDVRNGLQYCLRHYDWPPSLPEFLRACRPFLERETAFYIARKGIEERQAGFFGDWPHPAIYFAAVRLGQFEILNKSYQELEKRWGMLLDDELEKKNWGDIPDVRKALPSYEAPEVSEKINKIVKKLLDKKSKRNHNHKQWAYNILNNPEGRISIALRMAQEALGETELMQWAQHKLYEDDSATQASIKLAQTIIDLRNAA